MGIEIPLFPQYELDESINFFMLDSVCKGLYNRFGDNYVDVIREISALDRLLIIKNKKRENKGSSAEEDSDSLYGTQSKRYHENTYEMVTEYGTFVWSIDSEYGNFCVFRYIPYDFAKKQYALKKGLSFELGYAIRIKAKAGDTYYNFEDGNELYYGGNFSSVDAARAIDRAFESVSDQFENEVDTDETQIVEIEAEEQQNPISAELKELLDTAYKYADADYAIAETKALEADGIHYSKVGASGASRKDRISYRFYFSNPNVLDDIKVNSFVDVPCENDIYIPAQVIYKSVSEDASEEQDENKEIYIDLLFKEQIEFSSILSTGDLRLSASPAVRDIQQSAVEAILNGTAKAKYFNNVLGLNSPAPPKTENLSELEEDFKNREYPLTKSQSDAVIKAIESRDVYLVMGPPGTGKTTVILEWVKYFTKVKNMRVLISSQNNSAVDNVLKKLSGVDGFDVLRIGQENRTDDEAQHMLFENKIKDTRDEISKRVNEKIAYYDELYSTWSALHGEMAAISSSFEGRENFKASLDKAFEKIRQDYNEIYCFKNQLVGIRTEIINLYNEIFRLKGLVSGIAVFKRLKLSFKKRRYKKLRAEEYALVQKINLCCARYNSYTDWMYSELFVPYMLHCSNYSIYSKKLQQMLEGISYNSLFPLNENWLVMPFSDIKMNSCCAVIEAGLEKIKQITSVMRKWDNEVTSTQSYALEDMMFNNINVVGGTCIGVAINKRFANMDFDVTIIDEAGQIQLHNCIVPMTLSNKLIMLGDHKQLPPVVDSTTKEKIKQLGIDTTLYSKSLFEELYEKLPESHKTMLDTQFRIPGSVADILSKTFYNDNYKTQPFKRKEKFCLDFLSDHSLVLIDTSDSDERFEKQIKNGKKKNYINDYEAKIITAIYRQIYNGKYSYLTTTVLAGLNAQVSHLRESLKEYFPKSVAKNAVSTVDSFQGRESDVIIYSFTRSSDYKSDDEMRVGFLKDLRRLNVAMSRGKKTLIIVGDISYLKSCKNEIETEEFTSEKKFSEFLQTILDSIEKNSSGEIITSKQFFERIGGK